MKTGVYSVHSLRCNAIATANKKYYPPNKKKYDVIKSLSKLLLEISAKSGIISVEQIKGKSRKREIVEMRHFYFARARETTRESFEAIGKAVNRDHASVMHGIKSVNNTFGLRKKYNQFFNKTETPVLVKKIKEPIKEAVEINMQSPFNNIIPANNREHHGYRVHYL